MLGSDALAIPLGLQKDPSVDRILGEIPKDAKQKLGAGFKQAFKQIETIGRDSFGRLQRVMTSALGAAGIGGLGYELKKVADLQRATRQLGRTAGLTAEQEAELGQAVKDTAISTGISRDEQIAALQLLQDRFASVNDLANDNALAEQLELSASLAKGFGMSIEDSTVLLGALNKTGGVGTKDMVETLAFLEKAANMGASGLQDMGRLFPELLSESKAFGEGGVENVKDVAAMLETVTKKIGDPERARTYTRSLIAAFQKGDVSAKLMKNLQVSTANANGEFRDLSDIVDDTMNALGKMSEAKRAAVLGDIFGSEEAVSAMSTIMQNRDTFKAILEVETDSKDFSQYLAEQTDSAATAMERLAQEVRIIVDDAIEPLAGAIAKHKDTIAAVVKWMAGNPVKTALGIMFGPSLGKFAATLIAQKIGQAWAGKAVTEALTSKLGATGTMTVTAGVVNVNKGLPTPDVPTPFVPAGKKVGPAELGAGALVSTIATGAVLGLVGGVAIAESIDRAKDVKTDTIQQDTSLMPLANASYAEKIEGKLVERAQKTGKKLSYDELVELGGDPSQGIKGIFSEEVTAKIAAAVEKGAEAGTLKGAKGAPKGYSTQPPGEAGVQPG